MLFGSGGNSLQKHHTRIASNIPKYRLSVGMHEDGKCAYVTLLIIEEVDFKPE